MELSCLESGDPANDDLPIRLNCNARTSSKWSSAGNASDGTANAE